MTGDRSPVDLSTASLPVAPACAWFWEDDDPDLEHVCIQAPGHRGEHRCWCGGQLEVTA